MANWKYDLGEVGKKLRSSIHSETESILTCRCTLEDLLACFDWVEQHCSANVVSSFLSYREGVQESIQELTEMLEYEETIDDYCYAESMVNEWLEVFYDLCDMNRIWVGL